MAKKAPEHHDVLDDSSLDEYGVWVKAGPDDPVGFSDESISELLDDSPAINMGETEQNGSGPLLVEEMEIIEPMAGLSSAVGMNQKEQEVPDMSENDKTNAASPSDDLDIDNEISLATSEDQAAGEDDELGGLSDLLLNIDEEQDSEDTIYLEDDDLSLDLDDTDDIGLDSDMALGRDDDGYDEDINIPGLDDLNIENDDLGLSGFEDALAQLDEETIDIPDEDIVTTSSISQDNSLPSMEMHDIEEVGLDEFLQEPTESATETGLFGEDLSIDEDIVLDEPIEASMQSSALDDALVLDDPFDLNEEQTIDEEIILDDTSLDLDEDISLEPASYQPETGIEEPSFDSEFDDVAAVTDDLIDNTPAKAVGQGVENTSLDGSPGVLKGIEAELHAIRSELTDLRAELKKLRSKGVSKENLDLAEPIVNQTAASSDSMQDLTNQEIAFEPEMTAEEKATAGGGFFDDDEDETIALTGDELDNILNSAEFTEEVGESTNPDLDDIDMEEPIGRENDTVEMSVSADEGPGFEQNDFATDETVFEDIGAQNDFPPIEEINLQEIEDNIEVANDQLDDEPIDLGAGAESSEDDLVTAAEIVEDPFGGSEQAVEQMASMDIDNVLAGIEELKDNEEDIELFTGDELDSIELEIPDNNQGDGSIKEPAKSPQNANNQEVGDMSGGLKQEIKAVLAYMDQLLESLPEDKIEEFARSEHFEVYKKLFTELGL